MVIRFIVLFVFLTSCSSLKNEPINSNDFVIQENNSARHFDYNNK